MGVTGSDMHAAEQPGADSLLVAFKTIDEAGRQRHADVLDYWLSIRGDREFPPLHDLDTLQISDAGPGSVLLELIGGGEDAEIRHLGESLTTDAAVERIADAPRPSILASIAGKLSIVAISRNFLAFEDEFSAGGAITRCWVTLLPLSSAGAWIDYVYAFVTFETPAAEVTVGEQPESELAEADPQEVVTGEEAEQPIADAEAEPAAPAEPPAATEVPGFAELAHDPATADGYYGAPTVKQAAPRPSMPSTQANEPPVEAEASDVDELLLDAEPPVAEPSVAAEPTPTPDAPLRDMLAAVRAKADEARMAKLRSNTALYEGLGAAYDFALDAEDHAEEYLKLVEAQGLKIQLRSPMLPVMKLAFDGMCDAATIARLEAVLAWALEQELPRGTLAERIEAEGGLARILGGEPQT